MVDPEKHRSFVGRIWLEGASESPVWRGHLRNVHGDEECYFQSVTAMKEFLERISGVPFPMNNDADEDNG